MDYRCHVPGGAIGFNYPPAFRACVDKWAGMSAGELEDEYGISATPDNVDWARRKGNTVAHFRRSSYAIGLKMQQAGSTLADKHGLPVTEYASHGGAFPLTVAGAGVIGSITVSGLPQRADHELVVEALCAHLGHDYSKLALAKV